ncbi:hypothetical protein Mgra_00001323 [Meloidogyne graminicola]|uniref:Uncharacterized protein n=1 Tax=Meloidogyne graminicola TaxID=189291 RepID=A0A8S9ZZG3_9BILA|nr:hypothetical protein Mgra_00001323 [Meloidogyne graminicola]
MVDEVNPLQSNCAVKRSKNIQKHYKSFSALNGFEESIIERTTKERNLVEQVASNSNNNSSNTALPRLANALKSLLSSNGGFFKSKSVCVDAGDELIYYSNGSGPSTDSTRKSPLMPMYFYIFIIVPGSNNF